jgi:hypothetical protein
MVATGYAAIPAAVNSREAGIESDTVRPDGIVSLSLVAAVASASLAGHHHPAVAPDDTGAEWSHMPAPRAPTTYAIGSNNYVTAADWLSVSDSAEAAVLRFGV